MDDKKIRQILFEDKLFGETQFHEECPIADGFVRLDLLCLDDTRGLFSIEIKGDSDTMRRLEKQTWAASRYFEHNYVACTEYRIQDVEKCLDDHVGIIMVGSSVEIIKESKGSPNFSEITLLASLPDYRVETLLVSYGCSTIFSLLDVMSRSEIERYVFSHFSGI